MYSPQLPLARTRAAFSYGAEITDLEESLLRMIHDHNQSSLKLRDFTEKAKKNAIRSAALVSELLVDKVNGEVQEAFINEKRIELEIRALAETIVRFGKQTDLWLAASHAISTAVKIQTIVYDFIEGVMLKVYKSATAKVQIADGSIKVEIVFEKANEATPDPDFFYQLCSRGCESS